MARYETLWAAWDRPPPWLRADPESAPYPRYYHLTNDCDFVLREAARGASYDVWRDGRWEHYPPSEQDINSLREISLAEAVCQAVGGASREKV
jgi:hypothetical protein